MKNWRYSCESNQIYTSGQSYKRSTNDVYDSREVMTKKIGENLKFKNLNYSRRAFVRLLKAAQSDTSSYGECSLVLEKVLCVYERVRETVLKQNLSLKFHFPTKVASSHFEKSFSVFLNESKFHFLNILTHHLLEEGLHFVQASQYVTTITSLKTKRTLTS